MGMSHGKPNQPTSSHLTISPKTLPLKSCGFSIETSPYYQEKKPKSILPINQHQSIHPTITILLITTFQLTHSYYSSPLTSPLLLKRHNLPHTRNTIFGSQGCALASKWNGTGYAHPTNHRTTTKSIHWARMATKENPHNMTIMTLNHKDWTSQQLNLANHQDIHTIATIPPNVFRHPSAPQ